MKKDEVNLQGAIEDCVSAEDWRSSSFKCIIDSIQDIFESYASLDDPLVEPDDYFGLTVDALRETLLNDDDDNDEDKSKSSFGDPHADFLPLEEQVKSPEVHSFQEPAANLINRTTGLSPTNSSNKSIKSYDDDESKSPDPNDSKPKRPLSAYNLFFQLERERLIAGVKPDTPFTAEDVERVAINRRLMEQGERPKRKHRKSHGKISFAELARKIANKWKTLDPDAKDLLQERAAVEKARYLRELETWTTTNNETQRADFVRKLASSNSELIAPASPRPSQTQRMDGSFHMVTPDQYRNHTTMYEDFRERYDGRWNLPSMSSPAEQYSSNSSIVYPPFANAVSFDSCDSQCFPGDQLQSREFNNAEYEAFSVAERHGWNPSTVMHMMNELDIRQQSQQQSCLSLQNSYDSFQQQYQCRGGSPPLMTSSSSLSSSSDSHYIQQQYHQEQRQMQYVPSHGVESDEW